MVNKFRKLLLLVFTCTLILSIRINAEFKYKTVPEGEPAFTLTEANAYAAKLIPMIEKNTGRKFTKIPVIKIVDRKTLANILQKEHKLQLKKSNSQSTEEEDIEVLKELSTSILGKYGVIDGSLYLLPKNIYPIMKQVNIDAKQAKSIAKLVIAHELTHALQDQHTDLKRIWKIANVDESQAFNATFEGHAVFLQEQIGKELKLEETVIQMSRLLSANSLTLDDPALEMIIKPMATQHEQIYLGGRNFIQYHYSKGGPQTIWKILANPPVATSMIAKPETYSSIKKVGPNYSSLFDGLEQDFEITGWRITNLEIGQMTLRSSYVRIEENTREQILNQIVHFQHYYAQDPKSPYTVSVSAVVLKDNKIAEKYIKTLEQTALSSARELESSKYMVIRNLIVMDFIGIKADISRKASFELIGKGAEELSSNAFVRILRGNLMLEFHSENFEFEKEQIIKVAEKIFSRYNQLLKG